MQLPTTKIPPKEINPRTMILYGAPKIGKSTILSGLENNLIIDLEKGTHYLESLSIDVLEEASKNKKSVQAAIVDVIKSIREAGYPYLYSTIDTISKLEQHVHDWALTKYKSSTKGKSFDGKSLTELDYGLGYGLWREEFRTWLDHLSKLSKYTIFVGHVKDGQLTKDKMEVVMKDLNLTGQLKAIATSEVDAIGYIYINPENSRQRMISFLTSDEITCGNRCAHLEGKQFVISEKLEDGTVKTYWENIYKNNKQ